MVDRKTGLWKKRGWREGGYHPEKEACGLKGGRTFHVALDC